jgi:hypothetical protein
LIKSISLFLLFYSQSYAYVWEEVRDPVNQILFKAKEMNLSEKRYWQILLHYQPSLTGYKSLIDDPKFFLSQNGKTNPKAELEETIKAFFNSNEEGENHPQCRYPARYEWLKKEMNWDDNLFPKVSCNAFEEYFTALRPKSAVLVFPSFYMNNPASMFGHTLLRIDNSSESKLLSFAVNYAAYPESIGLLYPIKGIFGFYKGFFALLPYYDTIKTYNDTEQRDMWEYHLNLNEEEIHKMGLHLWELKEIYSYYYFFDENCSYNLLYLFEAARPSLHLIDKNWFWTIPTDTLRAIQEEGVIENVEFRPAKGTKIRYLASHLNDLDRENALRIIEQKLDPSAIQSNDRDKKIRILDLAVEEIQYLYNKHQIEKETYLKLFLSTLKERSRLGLAENELLNISIPSPPESEHRSSRINLGLGSAFDGTSFEEFRYRPAYHTLADPDEGFAKGSQIVFADTAVRFYNDGKIKLESFDLIDIVSLSPRDRFFKPLSYKVTTGLKQQMTGSGNDLLVYQLNPGAGMAFEKEWLGLVYGLGELTLNVSEEFNDKYALGGGLQTGIVKQTGEKYKIVLSLETLSFPMRNIFHENKISAIQVLKINQNNSLNISLLWDQVNDSHRAEGKMSWNYYF